MEIYYCVVCNIRLSDTDIKQGTAVMSGERRVLCKKCFTDVSGVAVVKAAPAKIISARMAKAAGSNPALRPVSTVKKKPAPANNLWLGAAGFCVVAAAVSYFALNNSGVTASPESHPNDPQAKPAIISAVDLPKPNTPKTEVPAKIENKDNPVSDANKFSPTFNSIPKFSQGNPLGFWEFLPSAYYSNTTAQFPVVFFFHGIQEGGNGTVAELGKVLKFGPPHILSDSTHPLHELFEQRGVIVISPQGPIPPNWWHTQNIAPFMANIFRHYRIDHRRIYLTGIIAGSLGINELMDTTPKLASEASAVLMAVNQGAPGSITPPFAGADVAAKVPYWAFTITSASNETFKAVNQIAGRILGTQPTSLQDSARQLGQLRTASFSNSTGPGGWSWNAGLEIRSNASPIITVADLTTEDTWTLPYDRIECWDWMFSQSKKP